MPASPTTSLAWSATRPTTWTRREGAFGAARHELPIARESGRPLDVAALPASAAVSVVTVAELHAGVLAAPDTATRARRLGTLEAISALEPLPVDAAAARRWAELRVRLGEQGQRVNVNDLWIAAVALANSMDIVMQDGDFDVIEQAGGPRVLHV